jgi:methyl-accepting chemotaxis protein
MDQVTQSNASQTEEMSGTAVALSGQSEQLQAVVEQFNLNSHATQTQAKTPVTRPKQLSGQRRAKPAPSRSSVSAERAPRKLREREAELVGARVGSDGFEEF